MKTFTADFKSKILRIFVISHLILLNFGKQKNLAAFFQCSKNFIEFLKYQKLTDIMLQIRIRKRSQFFSDSKNSLLKSIGNSFGKLAGMLIFTC